VYADNAQGNRTTVGPSADSNKVPYYFSVSVSGFWDTGKRGMDKFVPKPFEIFIQNHHVIGRLSVDLSSLNKSRAIETRISPHYYTQYIGFHQTN